MKKVKWMMSVLAVAAVLATAMVGCNDDEPPALALVSLTANGIDLNAATSATGIPVGANIVATFNVAVDAATANSAISLVRDYDESEFPVTVTVSGTTVTINPNSDFSTGSLFILKFGAGLSSSEGKVLTSAIERNFTTEGQFVPAGVIAHFSFENNTNDVVGNFDPTTSDVVDVTYVNSRSVAAGKAASFNGTTTIIEVPNADQFMSYGDFAISFWVKTTYTVGKGHFVLGLAAWNGFQFEIPDDYTWVKMAIWYQLPTTGFAAEDSWYPGNGQTKDNGGFQGWTINKDVSSSGGVGDTYFKDKWAHVVVTYNKTTKVNTMYINGEPVKQHNFNLFPDDNPKKNALGVKYNGNPSPGNKLALGFIQSRENRIVSDDWADPNNPANKHFKGLLDDVRIYNTFLNDKAVLLMYNSEKP